MRVTLGLGSNLGDRARNLSLAILALRTSGHFTRIQCSKIYENPPIGMDNASQKFLNAAVSVDTDLMPQDLLKEVKKIEFELGRKKKRAGEGYTCREIDLDILCKKKFKMIF